MLRHRVTPLLALAPIAHLAVRAIESPTDFLAGSCRPSQLARSSHAASTRAILCAENITRYKLPVMAFLLLANKYPVSTCTNTARRFFSSTPTTKASAAAQKKRKYQDPYALAQAKARKAANISRQATLATERSKGLGDPVRGVTTPFIESFDTALNLEDHDADAKSTESSAAANSQFMNHFISTSEFQQTLEQSRELTTPIRSQVQDPAVYDDKTAQQKLDHANAMEALGRIASIENAGAKDRLRVNIQRCIETFGRHNTDAVLRPKPSKDTAAADKTPRVGPDTGSSEVQAAILTAKIRALANFLETRGKKDKVNKRNLRLLVHKRQKHLAYLRRKERGGERWQNLIATLGLTEGTYSRDFQGQVASRVRLINTIRGIPLRRRLRSSSLRTVGTLSWPEPAATNVVSLCRTAAPSAALSWLGHATAATETAKEYACGSRQWRFPSTSMRRGTSGQANGERQLISDGRNRHAALPVTPPCLRAKAAQGAKILWASVLGTRRNRGSRGSGMLEPALRETAATGRHWRDLGLTRSAPVLLLLPTACPSPPSLATWPGLAVDRGPSAPAVSSGAPRGRGSGEALAKRLPASGAPHDTPVQRYTRSSAECNLTTAFSLGLCAARRVPLQFPSLLTASCSRAVKSAPASAARPCVSHPSDPQIEWIPCGSALLIGPSSSLSCCGVGCPEAMLVANDAMPPIARTNLCTPPSFSLRPLVSQRCGCCLFSSPSPGRLAIRQNDAAPTSNESSAPPPPSSTADSSASIVTSDAPRPTATEHSSDAPGSSNSTRTPTRTTMTTTSISVSTTPVPTATETLAAPGVDSLPIQPVISPALAVAGVLLMGFGIAYTFIGIRQKWLHIFGSVMYLVALAITVLLAYIVNPPVAPAIQGAYLVAAFIPGVIIGAASLIFKEIVEGLGCLLGGFCFSMWLLCLAPGGLVHSNGGRVGLIIAFSAAFFSLSFSHYTRTYGLIGCISFAGATSIVLGIDCFSRAGLKEFWIYNWDLNQMIFPLGTSSYPTTRGIKVESAVTVIIAVFGIMSQMKLWKVIKDRRAQREQARMQDEEDREHLEADLGRRIENANEHEKARWEEIYGSKGGVSSASFVGSTMASTYDPGQNSIAGSVRGIHSSADIAMEMHDMSGRGSPQTKRDSKERSGITITHQELAEGTDAVRRHHRTNTLERLEAGITEHPAMRSSPSGPPPVEPLPFNVPTESVANGHERNNSLTTNGFDFFEAGPAAMAHKKRASTARNSKRVSQGTLGDELNIPHDDDRASSLAATLDELTDDEDHDLPKLSRPTSPSKHEDSIEVVEVSKRRRSLSSMNGTKSQLAGNLGVPSDSKLNNRKSMPSIDDLEKVQQNKEHSLYTPSTNLSDRLELKTKPNAAAASVQSTASRRASLKKEFLPEDQPSVASIYRTNEWAKHQATAETPELEEIAPSDDGVGVEYANETSVPVDVHGLQQTALTGRASMARSPSQASSSNPYRNMSMQRSDSQLSLRQQQQSNATNGSPPLAQGPTMQRVSSQTRLNNLRSGNLSTPLMSQPLIESPTEDAPDARQTSPFGDSQQSHVYAHPSSSTTLLGQRETMLSARKSSSMLPGAGNLSTANLAQTQTRQQSYRQSSNPLPHSTSVYSNFNDPHQSVLPNDSLSIRAGQQGNSPISGSTPMFDDAQHVPADDDMPLSQRKELIRRASMSQSGLPLQTQGLQRSDSQFTLTSPTSPSNNNAGVIYDAHLPRRGPSFTTAHADQQQTRLANWRSDLQADDRVSRTHSTLLAQAQDEAHWRMREERRARGEREQQREWERSQQQGALDERMRSGDLLRTHAEVLRRMQRSANAS
ncbi:hypothetical protein FH972_023442 [Carpinus fangiana]|uniref:TM7S3/TM198-like domain-containing protein n=1 Tax=Carpinus fangiana TaxID=176857 RepID=A0A5N6KV74_9ROSI|nr:hypothetical protein FH972_023442 [Carpinus fangiana]